MTPSPSNKEERVVDAITGGEKGSKAVQLVNILRGAPEDFLTDFGRVYEMGAKKYSEGNWRKGYAWSLTLNAMARHMVAVMKGQWLDKESGLPHVCHVAWHCATLYVFKKKMLGNDDVGLDKEVPHDL